MTIRPDGRLIQRIKAQYRDHHRKFSFDVPRPSGAAEVLNVTLHFPMPSGVHDKGQFLDIEEVSSEIRRRVSRKAELAARPSGPATPPAAAAGPALRLAASDELWSQVAGEQLLVGRMPPAPPTLRGRLGRHMVESVRRGLFWLIPQIQAFQRAVAFAVREQTAALRDLAGRVSAVPALAEQVAGLENRLDSISAARFASLERSIQELSQAVSANDSSIAQLRKREERIDAEIGAREGLTRWTDQSLEALTERIRRLEEYTRATRAELLTASQQLSQARRPDAGPPENTPPAAGETGPSWYVPFQNSFRGSYDVIRQRMTVYLDRFEGFPLGGPDSPLVDLGCGRGEWLDLMRGRGMVAYGVDSTPGMVAECRSRGLMAQHEDVLSHLRGLPAASRGGFTAFHVVEHLPPAALEAVLDEMMRALKPGGIVILETPNPRNLFVSSRTFYLDPTHCKPLPSELLQFLVEARGFTGIEIVPLHPFPENEKLNLPDNPAAQFIDAHFFGPQDYGIVCRKPAPAGTSI